MPFSFLQTRFNNHIDKISRRSLPENTHFNCLIVLNVRVEIVSEQIQVD